MGSSSFTIFSFFHQTLDIYIFYYVLPCRCVINLIQFFLNHYVVSRKQFSWPCLENRSILWLSSQQHKIKLIMLLNIDCTTSTQIHTTYQLERKMMTNNGCSEYGLSGVNNQFSSVIPRGKEDKDQGIRGKGPWHNWLSTKTTGVFYAYLYTYNNFLFAWWF